MPEYIATIHQGTRNTRCVVFNSDGMPIATSSKEHRQIYLHNDWVEQRPIEIWERTQEVVANTLSKAKLNPNDIITLGITNQRETTIVWDRRTGKPYYNAIVWQDKRTQEICDSLIADGYQGFIHGKTGLPPSTFFSGPKIKWILDHVQGVRKAAEDGYALFGTVDSWIIWWLTGGPRGGSHCTDVTNASRTLLMDLRTLKWDEEILGIFKIPHQMLPKIVLPRDCQMFGVTSSDSPFQKAIPICGNLGDQQAALVGQLCFSPGEAKNTYSSGCFILLNTGESPVMSESGLLTTVAYQLGDQDVVYALEGSVATTGALVQWLRDCLGIIRNSSEIEDLARRVEDNGGLYIVPASDDLYTPYLCSNRDGIVLGMNECTNKYHIARAVLEATAYQTRAVIDAMEKKSGLNLKALKVNGSMADNDLLMKFQADILDVPLFKPKVNDVVALGAAYAAGLAVGLWKSVADLQNQWQADHVWKPDMDDETRQKLYNGWLTAAETVSSKTK